MNAGRNHKPVNIKGAAAVGLAPGDSFYYGTSLRIQQMLAEITSHTCKAIVFVDFKLQHRSLLPYHKLCSA